MPDTLAHVLADLIGAEVPETPNPNAILAAEVLAGTADAERAVRRVIAALLLGQLDRKDANTILFALQTLIVAMREKGFQPCSTTAGESTSKASARAAIAGECTTTGKKSRKQPQGNVQRAAATVAASASRRKSNSKPKRGR